MLAKEAAEKHYKEEKTIKKLSGRLEERAKHIGQVGVEGYIDEIKSRTVSSASGGDVMLGTPADAVAFAANEGNMQAMIKLARLGIHEYLDDKTLAFGRSRIARLSGGIGDVIEFVLDTMEERRKIANAVKTVEGGIGSVKEGMTEIKSAFKKEMRKEKAGVPVRV